MIPANEFLGTFSNLVSPDALQEFRIQTSTFAPEFGRSPGAQIGLATRSGTNRYSGWLFEYFRNDKTDANDWFANQQALPKPPLRFNDFGGSLGGPARIPHLYDGHDRTRCDNGGRRRARADINAHAEGLRGQVSRPRAIEHGTQND